MARGVARRVLPGSSRQRLKQRVGRRPWIGGVDLGALHRLTPFDRQFGEGRGTPIDRYYIEHFFSRFGGLEDYAVGDIRGHVLEAGHDAYARRFAGRTRDGSAIERLDIVDASEANRDATIVDDLTSAEKLASDTYDCIVMPQILHVIYDVRAVIRTLHRILKPGGVLLTTFAGISQRCNPDRDLWGDYWRFTTLSARRVFEETFRPEDLTVEAYGNVLAATGFLFGLAVEDLDREDLEPRDPDYELLIAVRAVKRGCVT
jgi:SAM-dependent methyltransferase